MAAASGRPYLFGVNGESPRNPAVAGSFYSGGAAALRAEVARHLDDAVPPSERGSRSAVVALVPHAGLMYSGTTAAHAWGRLAVPERVILLGPNHTGLGRPRSIEPSSGWKTPLGVVGIDAAARDVLASALPSAALDAAAHAREHSLEVQLPFLQVVASAARIVPICLAWLDDGSCVEFGRELGKAVRNLPGTTLIVASSDLNHYESQERTLPKDRKAIDAFLSLDPRTLHGTVVREEVSMCGVIPATVALAAATELGASRGELLDHRTSGDVSGDFDRVVGYASALVS